jgi:hypothetical protein
MGPRARAQAWALMEEECGNIDLARRLLQEASEKDPCDLYVWQARPPSQRPPPPGRVCALDTGLAAPLLSSPLGYGHTDAARSAAAPGPLPGRQCGRGSRADARRAQAWGVLEARAGDLPRARELFQQGVWSQPGNCSVSRVWQARRRPYPNSSRAVCCQPRGCWLGDQLSACAVPRMGGHTVCRLCRSAEPPGLVSVQRSFARAAVPARP